MFVYLVALSLKIFGIDDCAMIQYELDKLPSTGGIVKLEPKTYTCRQMVVLKKNNVTLEGAGRDKTILRLKDFSEGPLLVIGDNQETEIRPGFWLPSTMVSDVTVRDLTLDGNREKQNVTLECGRNVCGYDPKSIRNNALTVRRAYRVTIERVTAKSAISGGLVTEKETRSLTVRDFQSYDNFFDGFAGYETEDSTFTEMNLHDNRAAGISLDLNFNKNKFLNSRISRNGDVGIFARMVDGILFENVTIEDNKNHGAFLSDYELPNSCVINNEFRDVKVTGSGGHGIYLNSKCGGNAITGKSTLQKNAGGCYHSPNGELKISAEVTCT